MTSRPAPRLLRSAAAAVPVAGLLVAGSAVPATAATDVIGSTVYGDELANNLVVTCSGGFLAADGKTGDPCSAVKRLDVYAYAGNDTIDLSAVTAAAFPSVFMTYIDVEEHAFPGGADTVVGSPLNDVVIGDRDDILAGNAGDDALRGGASVSGGLGDDTIAEYTGSTVATGGPGDDRFVQFLPFGGIEGGTGHDTWEFDVDQGAKGLGSTFVLRPTADQLHVQIGAESASMLMGGIEEIDLVLMVRDHQTYDGSAFPGPSSVRGLAGPDVLSGGPVADSLDGGWGDDVLTGNGGADELLGGEGADTIHARDGVVDTIDCGGGTDTVVADASDVVSGCESVQLPPVPVPAPVPPAPQAPETSAVSGPSKVDRPKAAKFRFTSAAPGATFQCKLDKQRWKACSSPTRVATRKLKLGKHVLRVRAVRGGVVDATPSVKRFRVLA